MNKHIYATDNKKIITISVDTIKSSYTFTTTTQEYWILRRSHTTVRRKVFYDFESCILEKGTLSLESTDVLFSYTQHKHQIGANDCIYTLVCEEDENSVAALRFLSFFPKMLSLAYSKVYRKIKSEFDASEVWIFTHSLLLLLILFSHKKHQILKRPEEALSLLERFLPSGQLVMFPHSMMEKLVREHRLEWGRKTWQIHTKRFIKKSS